MKIGLPPTPDRSIMLFHTWQIVFKVNFLFNAHITFENGHRILLTSSKLALTASNDLENVKPVSNSFCWHPASSALVLNLLGHQVYRSRYGGPPNTNHLCFKKKAAKFFYSFWKIFHKQNVYKYNPL